MTPSERSPLKIGLALGSGAARGWAHLGVIDELAALGLKPDVIAGCSIGAVVGGAYAAGRFDALKDFAEKLDLFRMAKYFDLSFSGRGLFGGRVLSQWFSHLVGHERIEDLPLPFGCVAADIRSGREVWLREGPLTPAVRASIALPGLLTPLNLEGRWLIDGGVVNPVPISLARAMGADIVIAINLNADIFRPNPEDMRLTARATHHIEGEPDGDDADKSERSWFDELSERLGGSLSRKKDGGKALERPPQQMEIMNNAIALMGDRITKARAAGDPPDLMIQPVLSGVGIMDFHRAEEAAECGRKSVRLLRPYIEDLFGLSEPTKAAKPAKAQLDRTRSKR